MTLALCQTASAVSIVLPYYYCHIIAWSLIVAWMWCRKLRGTDCWLGAVGAGNGA